jgi:ABC-type glutathione transport system ATPase component
MNIGMIFISHDLAVVADVCTHIGVMHAGSLVEYGSRQEVLDCPGHPYTRMLVGSLLTLSDEPADLSSLVLPTAPMGPLWHVCGCPVQAMCPNATAACGVNRPIGWNCHPPTGSAVSMPGRNVDMKSPTVPRSFPMSDVTKVYHAGGSLLGKSGGRVVALDRFSMDIRPARFSAWSERAAAAKQRPAD